MSVQRRQGRPKRGEEEVGLSFILKNARVALRAKPFDLNSRKELSLAVGVTPALVSYYFPRDVNIDDLILSPVILSHRQTVENIVSSEMSPTQKALNVASYLISVFRNDKNLFNAYLALSNGPNAPYENHIQDMQLFINRMMEECGKHGIAELYPMTVRHGAFWGMCIAAAGLDSEFDIKQLRSVFGDEPHRWEPSVDQPFQ